MWTFLEVFICGKNMFSPRQPVIFSPKLSVLIFALLCDSSLLNINAKDKKSEVFSKNLM